MILLIGGSSHVGKSLLAHKIQHLLNCPIVHLDSYKSEFNEKDDVKLRSLIFPKAANVIKQAIKEEKDLIVEGCYIPQNYKNYFTDSELKLIKPFFIVMSEKYIREHFDDILRYENIIEERPSSNLNIDRLIMCSKNFKNDCLKNNSHYFEINEHYSMNELILLTKEQIM